MPLLPGYPRLNRDAPLARGLLGLYSGSAVSDSLATNIAGGGVDLASNAAGSVIVGVRGREFGQVSNSAIINAWYGVIPDSWKTSTLTVAWSGSFVASATGTNRRVFGINHNNRNSVPYASLAITRNGTNALGVAWNNGIYRSLSIGSAGSVEPVISIVLTHGDGVINAYINGNLAATTSTNVGTINYGSTANVNIGNPDPSSLSPNAACRLGCIWNRVLSATEARDFHDFGESLLLAPTRTLIDFGALFSGGGSGLAIPIAIHHMRMQGMA